MIAEAMAISSHTADSYIRTIYEKLHVRRNVEAVGRAVRDGLV